MRLARFGRVATLIAGLLLATSTLAGADTTPTTAGPALRSDGAPVERVLDIVSRVVDLNAAATKVDEGGHRSVNLATDVLFSFGSAQLSPKAHQTLDTAAGLVRQASATTVKIDGYTDSIGDDATNLTLSRQRAQAVADGLMPLLSDAKVTFTVQGHGSADPIAPNTTAGGADNPEGRALNRRVTVSYGK
jgi:outer membrane protein OmpA-like peptidoglycan-associated protein